MPPTTPYTTLLQTYPRPPRRVDAQRLPQQAALHGICQAAQQLVCIFLAPARKAAVQRQQSGIERLGALCVAVVAKELPPELRFKQAANAGLAALA